MSTIPPWFLDLFAPFIIIYNILHNFEIFNNTGLDYLMVPIIFIVTFIVGYIIKSIILSKVKKSIPEGVSTITIPILDRINKLINISTLFVLALYLSTQHLNLPPVVELFFNVVIFGALVLAIFRFISGLIDISADYRDSITKEDNQHILSFIKLIAKVSVAVVLSLLYLNLLNIDATTFMAGLGVAGITIAFALQNIAADLFAAVAIYLDKPFIIGDYINVNGKVGRIERIGLRSTHIRSIDGPLIVFSNQKLTQSEIINYKNMEERRITQTIGVGSSTPVEQLRELPNLLHETINDIENIRIEKIWLKELGEFSSNFEVIYHVEDPDVQLYREIEQEINLRVIDLLKSLEIKIPVPKQEVIISEKSSLFRPGINKTLNLN